MRFSGKILSIKLTTEESHAWVENKDLQAIQEMARSDEHAISCLFNQVYCQALRSGQMIRPGSVLSGLYSLPVCALIINGR